MEVIFRAKRGVVSVDAPCISVARLVAESFGYCIDVEPMEPGKYRLIAVKGAIIVRLNGASLEEVSTKFIETIVGEKHET